MVHVAAHDVPGNDRRAVLPRHGDGARAVAHATPVELHLPIAMRVCHRGELPAAKSTEPGAEGYDDVLTGAGFAVDEGTSTVLGVGLEDCRAAAGGKRR